eukprot:m51a1_g7635 hypothetical protein (701) ;mRNA; r:332141-334243
MDPKKARAAPAAESRSPRADDVVLSAAYLLREHVVPALGSCADLCALALSLPPALAAPCVSASLSAHGPRRLRSSLLDRVYDACSRENRAEIAALRSRGLARLWATRLVDQHDAGPLARWACAALAPCSTFWAEHVPLLAAFDAPTDDELRASGGPLAWACASGLPLVLAALPPSPYAYPLLPLSHDAAVTLLSRAARAGCADVVGVLARAPFSVGGCHARARSCEALREACASGSLDVVVALSRPPFSLSQAELRESERAAELVLLEACRSGSARLLAALLSPPYSLAECIASQLDEWSRTELLRKALHEACMSGHADAVQLICAPPLCVGPEHARMRSNNSNESLLHEACRLGRKDVIAMLVEPPVSLGREDALLDQCHSLICALQSLDMRVVRVLARPPFSLTRDDVLEPVRAHLTCSLDDASGVLRWLPELAEPPFSLTGDDLRFQLVANGADLTPFELACLNGAHRLLQLLSRAPFSLGHADAAAHGALSLRLACRQGWPDVVAVLGAEPYSLGQSDARLFGCAALVDACANGCEGVVRLLGQPPFSLGQADARAQGGACLAGACAAGFESIVTLLGGAPWHLGADDARASDCLALRMAVESGRTEVVRLLGRPPYSLGQAEARANSNFALRVACQRGDVQMVRLLKEPPWSLGQEDAVMVNRILSDPDSMQDPIDEGVYQVLKEPPYSLVFPPC